MPLKIQEAEKKYSWCQRRHNFSTGLMKVFSVHHRNLIIDDSLSYAYLISR